MIDYSGVSIEREQQLLLHDVTLRIDEGEFVYLIGKVGSGKSSLLKSIYAEMPIVEGAARVFDYDLRTLRRSQIPYLRRRLGIIFQDFQLLVDRTVQQNLAFVLKATGWTDQHAMDERIDEVLKLVGMENKGYRMPNTLSGGEQQRIVIARALLNEPTVILADEPTGNLDPETGNNIVQLLYDICHTRHTAVLMSTHNLQLLSQFPGRVLRVEDGKVSEETSADASIMTDEPSADESSEEEEVVADATESETMPVADAPSVEPEEEGVAVADTDAAPSEVEETASVVADEPLAAEESPLVEEESPLAENIEATEPEEPAENDETTATEVTAVESYVVDEVEISPMAQSVANEEVAEEIQSDSTPDSTDSNSVADHCSQSETQPEAQNCSAQSDQTPAASDEPTEPCTPQSRPADPLG